MSRFAARPGGSQGILSRVLVGLEKMPIAIKSALAVVALVSVTVTATLAVNAELARPAALEAGLVEVTTALEAHVLESAPLADGVQANAAAIGEVRQIVGCMMLDLMGDQTAESCITEDLRRRLRNGGS